MFGVDHVEQMTNGARAPVGARASDVGVSGFLLMGGDSWLSSQHGFGTQNIASLTIVKADGSIETVSPTNNPDLFNAVRGSSGQMGIVTSFTLLTHPVSTKSVLANVDYADQDNRTLAEIAERYMKQHPGSDSNIVISFGADYVSLQYWYNGSVAQMNASGVYDEFWTLNHTVDDFPTDLTYAGLNGADDTGFGGRGRTYMDAVPISDNDPEMYVRTLGHLRNLTNLYPQFYLSIFMEPLKPGVTQHIPVPGVVWPPNDGYMAAIIGLIVSWQDPTDDDLGNEVTNLLRTQITNSARELGLLNDKNTGEPLGYFNNYAKYGADDVTNKMLFQDKLEQLQQAKARFDPECVFYQLPALGSNCYDAY